MTAHHFHVVCRDLVERVTELLEGTLDPDERIRLEQHVVWCEMCADYIDQIRRTSRLLEHVGEAEDILDRDDAAALAADLVRRAAAQGDRS